MVLYVMEKLELVTHVCDQNNQISMYEILFLIMVIRTS